MHEYKPNKHTFLNAYPVDCEEENSWEAVGHEASVVFLEEPETLADLLAETRDRGWRLTSMVPDEADRTRFFVLTFIRPLQEGTATTTRRGGQYPHEWPYGCILPPGWTDGPTLIGLKPSEHDWYPQEREL